MLFKALQETTARYPRFNLIPPSSELLTKRWKEVADTFCDQAEKIALRNCPAYDDHLMLLEEELFLGTLGTSAKMEHSDQNLLHRSRLEIAQIVKTLRREIKDMKPDDCDSDSSSGEDEPTLSRQAKDAKKRLARLERLRPRIYGGDEEADESDDSDVVEIPRPTSFGSASRKREVNDDDSDVVEIPRPSGSKNQQTADDGNNSDSSIEEIAAPDPKEIVIKRAFNACQYGLEVLSEHDVVPYGTRLFTYVALDVLLFTIRRNTRAKKDADGDPVGAEATL